MTTLHAADAAGIAGAVATLRRGGLVALPTETVYGLAADALDEQAVARIFAAKGRPADHPLIVHLPDAEHMTRWARSLPREALALARAFWPGPLTLIVPRADDVPDIVTGGQDSVGLRVPAHPVALAVLRAFDSGIAAPSANRFGRISPTTAAHVADELGDAVDYILDGGSCEVGLESTIVDLSRAQPEILRPGMIHARQIEAVIGRSVPVRSRAGGEAPRASGTLAAHYAPCTPLQTLATPDLLAAITAATERIAVIAIQPPPAGLDASRVLWLAMSADAATYARTLYARLREADTSAVARILLETPPDAPEWQAIRDRLGRAVAGSGQG